jgi:hypothetical protein
MSTVSAKSLAVSARDILKARADAADLKGDAKARALHSVRVIAAVTYAAATDPATDADAKGARIAVTVKSKSNGITVEESQTLLVIAVLNAIAFNNGKVGTVSIA